MKLSDINPHIRFAEQITYVPQNTSVYAKDCRLFYISYGKGYIYINGNQYDLSENTLFYCCGGSDYTIAADAPIQLYSLNFDLTQNFSHLHSAFTPEVSSKTNTPIDNCRIEDSCFLNSFYICENAFIFKDDITDIVKEFSSSGLYFREYCSSALKKLLICLHRSNNDSTGIISVKLQKTIEYINLNFDKEINNATLSKIAGYHEFYLNRLFNRYMGMSMHKYILNLRIYESKRLLLNSDMSISEIAIKIGFNSNSHFSTIFKKELMMTPFEYRSRFRNNI